MREGGGARIRKGIVRNTVRDRSNRRKGRRYTRTTEDSENREGGTKRWDGRRSQGKKDHNQKRQRTEGRSRIEGNRDTDRCHNEVEGEGAG